MQMNKNTRQLPSRLATLETTKKVLGFDRWARRFRERFIWPRKCDYSNATNYQSLGGVTPFANGTGSEEKIGKTRRTPCSFSQTVELW